MAGKNELLVFCVSHSRFTGAMKAHLDLLEALRCQGQRVMLLTSGGKIDWRRPRFPVRVVSRGRWEQALPRNTAFVVASSPEHARRVREWGEVRKVPVAFFVRDDLDFLQQIAGAGTPRAVAGSMVRSVLRRLLQWPIPFLASSPSLTRQLRQWGARRVYQVPDGIRREWLYPRKEEGPVRGWVTVTRPERPHKGFEDLCRAFRSLSPEERRGPLEVVCSQRPPRREYPEAPDLHYHWALAPSGLGKLLRSASALVATGRAEAFSIPPLEAMACGIPVIAAASEGVKNYARDGWNCLLYRPGRWRELARRMETLHRNPELCRRLVRGGLHTSRRYTWDKAARAFLMALKEIRSHPG